MNAMVSKLLVLILTAIYVTIFLWVMPLSDTASFGGDIWEYQSMAVNFAKGHGIGRFGSVEDFSVYRFETDPDVLATEWISVADRAYFIRAGEGGGTESFFRTPGYYLFLGILYKLFGVSPLIAKQGQLILLCIMAAALPWIGMFYWGRLGFWSGCIASPMAIASIYRFSAFLYTESLITFAVFLIVVAYMFFEARRTLLRALLVGVTLGVGLLVKASLLFIPPLLGLVLLCRSFRTRKSSDLLHLSGIMMTCILTIAPWSVYISMRLGKFVLLSTQTEEILLDAHNEYVERGIWHSEWKHDPQSFYHNDGLEGKSALLRVINFYRHFPSLFPRLAAEKLIEGFRPFPFFLVSIALLVGEWIARTWRKIRIHIPPIFLIIFVNFAVITIVAHVDHSVYPSRVVKPMDFLFILFGVHRILLLLCAASRPFSGRIATLWNMRSVR